MLTSLSTSICASKNRESTSGTTTPSDPGMIGALHDGAGREFDRPGHPHVN
jgi:hypothetical protein